MRGVVYCNKCGCSNPGGMKRCQTCNCELEIVKNNPITSADFANRKMAIFDIDNTILDPEQRFIDARRAGVIDKDGAPKTKGGWKKRGEFLYKEDRLLKDRVMPNSLDLIEHLMEQGYVIAYCTARPFTYYEATKYQLEQKRFPLFQNGVGEDLLFCKRSMGQRTPLYKKGVVETLQSQYDVRLFFDDKPENLAAALQADVPGVYASVKEYWNMIGVRSNSHTVQDPEPHKWLGRTYDQDKADADERKNPIKRGSDSKGSYYRWGKNQKYYYKTGSKTSRENARKKAHNQAKAAFAGGYRGKYNPGEEYSEDYMVPRDVDTLGKAADRIEDTYYEGLEVPEWWKSKMSVTADKADSLADAISYVADNPRSNPPKDKIEKGKKLYKHMNGKDPAKTETKTIDIGDVWYQVGEGGCWEIGYMSGKETGSSSQKYRHTFNEETKNGDFPKLYATIPDKGKPMLIITGGTWKIKTDEDGVAWIYD